MELTGWGRYPRIDASVLEPEGGADARALLESDTRRLIARGRGRSYGDSALASRVLSSRYLDHFIEFDGERERLHCAAGVSLAEVLEVLLPRGRFLPVLPGTQLVSVGGAIAADIHGKNHHRDGSFCDHVEALTLCLADGSIVRCSREQDAELFHASCGGMGLTGIILDAELRLIPVPGPVIENRTLIAGNLGECLALLREHEDSHYAVAWIDSLAQGAQLGRGCVFLGEHVAADAEAVRAPSRSLSVPFSSPGMLLNRYSMRLFNSAYFWRQRQREGSERLHYQRYFFPLDGLHNWNRLYGSEGFLQYQLLLPHDAAAAGLQTILTRVAASGRASFLAVLKLMGPGNDNLLSFPHAGFTLTLDFKCNAPTMAQLDELDEILLDHGGRLYLAKDARMSAATFRRGYPDWEKFLATKRRVDPGDRFASLQSARLGLTSKEASDT